MASRTFRRQFVGGLLAGLRVISPILSGLLVVVVALGLIVGWIEGWSVQESIYFAFVTGLTIGYGDLAPKLIVTRALAVAIGFCGVLFTALVAAVAVRALTDIREAMKD
jgi:Ion channel